MMKFDDKKYLAEQIKYHRKKLGMTQSELAEKVDLSDQHISRIESGCYVPSLKSFFLIIDALKIDLSVFGVNLKTTSNPKKDSLIEIISKATDAELIFYENTLKSINESFSQIKKELF